MSFPRLEEIAKCCGDRSKLRRLSGRGHAVLLAVSLLGGCVPANRYAPTAVNPDAERRAADSPASLNRIGATALRSGDLATASSFFGRALALAPGDETAALGGAQAVMESGRTDQALEILRNATSHAKSDARLSLDAARGKLLVLDHRPAEAEAVFRDGLRTAPGSVRLLTGLGVALDSQHRFADAERSFREALAGAPNNLPARNDLALSIALAGDPGAALHALLTLRADAGRVDATDAALKTIDGNIALVRAMQGDVAGAQKTDARAADSSADPARNTAFYSTLAGDRRLGTSSGLPDAGGGAD